MTTEVLIVGIEKPSPGSESSAHVTDAFLNAYASSCRNAAEQALKSLDSAINWALTLTLSLLAFVVNAGVIKGLPNPEAALLLLVVIATGFPMLVHFSIRAAKNYLNVIRFAKLEREALKCNLRIEGESKSEFLAALHNYHVGWKGPIGASRIVGKVLFEFGFFYLLAIVGGMFWYIARNVNESVYWVLVLVSAFVPILVELSIFSHSPYIKDGVPDSDARKLS